MSTEALGFLIIAGTVVVLVLRRQFSPQTKPEPIETAAGQLQQKLEQSADEIITRMGDEIDRLEALVTEADQRSALLEQQIARIRKLQAVETEDFSGILNRSMAQERTLIHPEDSASGVDAGTDISVGKMDEGVSKRASTDGKLPFVRVRELLRQGCSSEEISRETHMGRGAIELIRQMNQYHH